MTTHFDTSLLVYLQQEHGLLQASEPVPAVAVEDKLREGKFSEEQIMRFMRAIRQHPPGRLVTGVSRYWGDRPPDRLQGGNSPYDQLVQKLWARVGDKPWFRALTDSAGAYNAGHVGQHLLEEVALAAMEVGVIQSATDQTIPTAVYPQALLVQTPYINTLPPMNSADYPGDLDLEEKIEDIIRWNALIVAHSANKKFPGLGGHIATYASEATLDEVGLNHFFSAVDQVFTHGHSAPGRYARAYLEGRITRTQMEHFRRETSGGLPSYPHPWRMPEFWQFPTVSMGLGPLSAIYQARFNRYLENRGIVPEGATGRVWAFLGDGEMDEVEARGAAHIASRDGLDNLVFMVNCNLQRLDGAVRPNGHIIQELEASFRGAGWNVIKLLWGSKWDPLFERDTEGVLARRLEEVPDGDWQTYVVRDGNYIRDHLFNTPELKSFIEGMSDEEVRKLVMDRGGHDRVKVFQAYQEATRTTGKPIIILAQTIKGYKTPMAGIMRTHQEKKVKESDLPALRDLYDIPLTDDELGKHFPFYKPEEDSPEMVYLRERREALGGFIPERQNKTTLSLPLPPDDYLSKEAGRGTLRLLNGEGQTSDQRPTTPQYVDTLLRALQTGSLPPQRGALGQGARPISTTMALVEQIKLWTKHPEFGGRVVPIIPDEGRTFGMEELFKRGIYDPLGMNFTAADAGQLLTYNTARNGQLLQEGISEAGAMASFIAAATSYSTHGVPMVPIYVFYSMFGIQRTGDQWWQNGDARGRGFLIGATAGRTTLNGEGLQHEDGHSLLMSSVVPNLKSYDPAFAYEMAVIMEEGLKRMYGNNENIFYYVTAYNENFIQPPMPVSEGVREGILKGLYKFALAEEIYANGSEEHQRTHILASGPLMQHALIAQKILAEKYKVMTDVWSATSYTELRREAMDVERWNLLHPDKEPRVPYVTQMLGDKNLVVAVSDFMKAVPDQIAKYVPGKMITLGTDGFGLSDTREALRDYFEIDHRYIVYSTLYGLAQEGKFDKERLALVMRDLGIDPEKPNPATDDPMRGHQEIIKGEEEGGGLEEIHASLLSYGYQVLLEDLKKLDEKTLEELLEVLSQIDGGSAEKGDLEDLMSRIFSENGLSAGCVVSPFPSLESLPVRPVLAGSRRVVIK